ncbi:MAG: RIO1 family regulatory kinase/ATPase [Dehalococcoidia bacterium]
METELPEGLDEFYSEGLLGRVVRPIHAGKEATAYLCTTGPKLQGDHVVAKVYHHRSRTTKRGFAQSAIYQEGRVVLDRSVRQAIKAKKEHGRKMQDALWVDHEFEWLSNLEYAGADVPAPIVCNEQAILMEFIGEGDVPAPKLQEVELEQEEVPAVWSRVLWNVEVLLRENCIHGDLSAFNILYNAGRPVLIDLPQCVDPRFNRQAQTLLERDLGNVARYFQRYGVEVDVGREARRLWKLWLVGDL